ncbi:hypothetical protein ACRTDU_19885 [Sunxiuqinia elliptica]|uniref:Uncharacterized protein n=1 Tax=Sunxiuqinia elliptica TaxID=655355 RepID=A0A1I2D516_9BACT|nr:hypothetical protein [Sunxiuqinia elliptica]SFE75602.1 hypothetical protein SAMN05216283_101936 [Sunxiuqinia elliptica]
MKKQILTLTLFVLAIFAGSYSVFGQATVLNQAITASQPIPALSCVAGSEPLHPYPGQSYTYTMDGSSGAETADEWTWFVTKDPEFINATGLNTANMLTTASGDLLNVGTNYGTATAGANSIDITWSPEVLANTLYQGTPGTDPSPTFVVGYATGTNCADNIQVYEINPKFNFTIDIANVDTVNSTLGWDAAFSQCVDIVRSATYNSTTKEIDVNYGKDILYFEVAAANFVTDFTPTFHLISGLVGTQTAVVTLHPSLADAKAGTNVAATANWDATSVGTDWATGVQFTSSDPALVVSGVSLFVKVVISNNTEESLTDNIFALAVDAQDNNQTGIWDMEDDDCTTATDAADQADFAEHTVTPRPQIDHATPDAGAPDPTTVITKTP